VPKERSLFLGWVLAIIAVAVILSRLPEFFVPINRDSGLFAYAGWRVLHGAHPYIDFWDNKLPGVFYLNALGMGLFGATTTGLVIFQMIYVTITGWLFYLLGRRFTCQWVALTATVLFVFYHGSYCLVESGNFTETYLALPELAAVLLMLRWSGERKGLVLPFAAGVMGALAGIIKQPAGLIVPVVMLYAVFSGDKRRGLAAALATVVGVGIVAAFLVFWLSAGGMLPEAINANIVFNKLYFLESYTYGLPAAKTWLVKSSVGAALPIFGIVAGLVALCCRRRKDASIWLFAPWVFFGLVGLSMGGRFTNHYFIQILTWSMLLWAIFAERVRATKRGRIALAAISFVLMVGPVWRVTWEASVGKVEVESVVASQLHTVDWIINRRLGEGAVQPFEQVASWVRAKSTPDDSIYVWGWDTRIAFLAKRRIPSRYLHTHPLGAQGFDRDRRILELKGDLERGKPKFIIDGSAALPTTAPPLRGPVPPSFCWFFRLDGYEPIKELVAKRYHPVENIGGYIIYARND
jgi:hypothetical protein